MEEAWQARCRQQTLDTVRGFGGAHRFAVIQQVVATSRMRVHEAEWLLLGFQRFKQPDQDRVLEHIGEVAGMECMAIVHGRSGPELDDGLYRVGNIACGWLVGKGVKIYSSRWRDAMLVAAADSPSDHVSLPMAIPTTNMSVVDSTTICPGWVTCENF